MSILKILCTVFDLQYFSFVIKKSTFSSRILNFVKDSFKKSQKK